MADIRENLTLVDRFSGTFQRWVDGIKNAVEGSDRLKGSSDTLIRAQAEQNLTMKEWEERAFAASQAGDGVVGSLSNMRAVLQGLEQDIFSGDAAFLSFEKSIPIVDELLKQNGLTWAESAEGVDKFSLLLSKTPEQLERLGYLVRKTGKDVEKVSKTSESAAARGHTLLDKLGRKVLSIGAVFLTARKLIQYFRQAIERAPDNLAKPYEKLKENIRNIFDRSAVSALAALTNSFNRLNEALASPAGQQFVNVMGKIGYIIGTVVGGAIDLLIQLIGLVIDAFGQMGVSASDVVTFIASIAAGLYVTLYNIVATMWNVIASFAEFLVNVWSHPAEAIRTLFWRLADAVLGFIQSIGDGFDALMSKLGISTGVGGWLAGIRSSAETKLNDSLAAQSQDSLVLERMDLLNYADTVADWTQKSESFDPATLQLKAINANTRSSARSAASIDKALNDLDIAALIDVAERKFISQVNLTSQTPVITVNGANTGNTQQDRINLANTIRDILVEQIASSPMRSSNAYGV